MKKQLTAVKRQHWQVQREGQVERDEVEGDLDPICPSLFEEVVVEGDHNEGLPPQEQDDNMARGDEERQREQRVALDIIEEANMLIEESVEEWHQTVEEGIKMMQNV